MEFLIGLSVAIILVAFFTVVIMFKKLLPPEYSLALIFIMLFGDGLISYVWCMSFREIVGSETSLRRGIAVAFAIASFYKAIYLLIHQLKEDKLSKTKAVSAVKPDKVG